MATHFSTLAGESHGQRRLVEYSPWDLKESDMTEKLANRLLLVHSVMSDSLRPHGLQHTRLPCLSPFPGTFSNACPLSQWCHPTTSSLLLLLSVFPKFRIFSTESTLHNRWSKYCSFSFIISSSNEYSGLISFRIDWFDLLADQGALKSLIQHHSSKASVPWCSAFFMVQLSHPHMTNGKVIALTRWNFVGKVMFLFCNTLSRFVIAVLPRSKHLLILLLPSPSAVILEPKKIKSLTVSIASKDICHEVMGPNAVIFVF